jgi:hypothetical protein
VRQDFAAGRIVVVDGWVVSRTEAELAACAGWVDRPRPADHLPDVRGLDRRGGGGGGDRDGIDGEDGTTGLS